MGGGEARGLIVRRARAMRVLPTAAALAAKADFAMEGARVLGVLGW